MYTMPSAIFVFDAGVLSCAIHCLAITNRCLQCEGYSLATMFYERFERRLLICAPPLQFLDLPEVCIW